MEWRYTWSSIFDWYRIFANIYWKVCTVRWCDYEYLWDSRWIFDRMLVTSYNHKEKITSGLSAYQAAWSIWVEPLLLASSSVPAAAPGTAGQSGAASRTPLLSHSRFPCSPDRISQNPCSHGTGVCLTPGLLTLQFRLNDHRESPPISMWLLWLPFITSSMLV